MAIMKLIVIITYKKEVENMKKLYIKIKKYFNLVVSWFTDDWYDVYIDSNLNHGQGPITNDKEDEKWNFIM